MHNTHSCYVLKNDMYNRNEGQMLATCKPCSRLLSCRNPRPEIFFLLFLGLFDSDGGQEKGIGK